MARLSRVSLELDLETAGVAAVGAAMASGATTSAELVEAYLDRIATLNPLVNAVRCLAPDAHERAAALDAERAEGRVRGPLHGVPVLLKDNIDVAGLPTTAGALALEHSVPDRDADLVVRLREAGAVVIGKTNLTEMANCMAENMPSGYSSLGGQVLNPYDVRYDPSGSSSGSGAAAALGLATVTVGTETDGSILSPASHQSLVGLKPTLGLVPGRGILPIASSQDCAGPMCRTVADAAALLGVLAGETYGEGSGPDTLRGVRLAMPPVPDRAARAGGGGVPRRRWTCCASRGAILVEVPALPETDEFPVLLHEFARDLDAYLATLPEGAPIRTMRELVAWNDAHADEALKYGQVLLEKAAGRRPRGRARGVPDPAGSRPRGRRRARHRRDAGRRRRRGDRVPRPVRVRRWRPGPATPAWSCRPGTAARTAGRSG